MADYMDMINDTFDKIIDKVKDYTNGKSAKEIYEEGRDKISGYSKIAALKFDINGAKEQAKDTFTEIGRLYYEKTREAPEEDFKELFARIDSLRDEVNEKREKIADIRNGDISDIKDIEVEITEFGEVVDNYENS